MQKKYLICLSACNLTINCHQRTVNTQIRSIFNLKYQGVLQVNNLLQKVLADKSLGTLC